MPIRRVVIRRQLGAALLQRRDERHGLPVERRVLGGPCRADVRLQGHVAEILQRENAQRIGMPDDRRHRQRHLAEQLRDVDEGQRRELDRTVVKRQDDRRPSAGEITRKYRRVDASPVRGTTRWSGATRPLPLKY